MAKIGSLQVGTVKFMNNALSQTVQADYSVKTTNVSPNIIVATINVLDTFGSPLALFWTCLVDIAAIGGGIGDNSAQFAVKRRNPSAFTVYAQSAHVADRSSFSATWSGSYLDRSPGASPTYDIEVISLLNKGTLSLTGTIMGMITKK